jgi:hypothetical protein
VMTALDADFEIGEMAPPQSYIIAMKRPVR